VLLAASSAEARIECRGNFQITKHGPISTPHCEEKQIARVARSYGFKATNISGGMLSLAHNYLLGANKELTA
jgi:hypothetical protein